MFNEECTIVRNKEYYTGLACLIVLYNNIQKKLSESGFTKENSSRLSQAFKKLHEHRTTIYLSMIWFIKKLKVENQNITDAMAVYKQCSDNMNKLYLMALEFEFLDDLSIM